MKQSQAPHLARKSEFEEALANYQPSNETKQILAQTPFVTMLAPTSTGRNTIINRLLKTERYYFIVSDTTRPKRYNDGVLEQDGVQYFFRSEEDMLNDIKSGKFIEAEVIFGQQVSGVSIREVKQAGDKGKIAITDVDLMGSINIHKLKPDALSIVVLPPSFDEWLRRIHKRTKVTDLELHRRLQTASNIFKQTMSRDDHIFIVNDNLDIAVKTVDDLARFGRHDKVQESQARQLATELYESTCGYLRKNAPEFEPA